MSGIYFKNLIIHVHVLITKENFSLKLKIDMKTEVSPRKTYILQMVLKL